MSGTSTLTQLWRALRDGLSNSSQAPEANAPDQPAPAEPSAADDQDTQTPVNQASALVWRKIGKKKKIEVLLITSRDTGRWVLPKGWIEDGEDGAEAARREAWEEAGVEGPIQDDPLGQYSYEKVEDGDEAPLACLVAVYALAIERQAKDWPERDERERKWVAPAKAAKLVDEPELQELLETFDTDWKKMAA